MSYFDYYCHDNNEYNLNYKQCICGDTLEKDILHLNL